MTTRPIDDAHQVAALFATTDPATPVERMAVVGARHTIKRTAEGAAYRAGRKAQRLAAGEVIRPRGRPRKDKSE